MQICNQRHRVWRSRILWRGDAHSYAEIPAFAWGLCQPSIFDKKVQSLTLLSQWELLTLQKTSVSCDEPYALVLTQAYRHEEYQEQYIVVEDNLVSFLRPDSRRLPSQSQCRISSRTPGKYHDLLHTQTVLCTWTALSWKITHSWRLVRISLAVCLTHTTNIDSQEGRDLLEVLKTPVW